MSVTTVSSMAAARPASARPPLALLTVRALFNVLLLSGAAAAALSAYVLIGLGGLRYYSMPVATRGYDAAHELLRPSGPIGQTFGIIGWLLMMVPFFYMLRKRLFKARAAGSLKMWLEIHIFCGIVGPAFVTYHTAFKFNGIVSVAYWSMMIVALSGFVGRYLYVRIPRTIRGVELSDAEIEGRANELKEELQWTVDPAVMARLEAFEHEVVLGASSRPTTIGVLTGGWALDRQLKALRAELATAGVSATMVDSVAALFAEREQLLRRLRYLHKTKQLFDLWHVFHLPLVYVMLAIVGLHVALVLYMGYVPFRW
ncbi:MAG: hypothetical protein U0Q12_20955 [Vicinamibacterales bacterium]